MNPSEVVVTGLGVVSPLGPDLETTWRRILDGQSALRSWADLEDEGFPMPKACRVSEGSFGDGTVPDRRRGRTLGVVAAAEALEQAGLVGPDGTVQHSPDRIGVFVGTTMGESAVFEDAVCTGQFDLAEGGGHVFAATIAERFGLTGPRRTFGTACAAGNYAIGSAARALASGRVDVAVAGGVEPFSRIAMLGFGRMRAMAPDGCCPFGVGRRGMTLGEGAGFLILERNADAEARGAKTLARFGGLGLSADAHHPTAPLEDGSGMAAAMRAGLQRAGLSPQQVGWISAHGTGTPRSDAAEALAIRSTFGDSPPPVSSAKGALGHSLGAATAIEAALSVCALSRGVLPPNVVPTPHFEIDEQGMDVVIEPRETPDLEWVMSCGYAFGGLDSRADPGEGVMTVLDGPEIFEAQWDSQWASPDLVAAGDTVAIWVANTLKEADLEADGLYVATPDAGAREALAFWMSAQETSYAFAAPAAFPWTLANSPTGRISAQLNIVGPCYTFVGDEEAVVEAFLSARDDLAAGAVERALVVSVAGDRPVAAAGGEVSIQLCASVLTNP